MGKSKKVVNPSSVQSTVVEVVESQEPTTVVEVVETKEVMEVVETTEVQEVVETQEVQEVEETTEVVETSEVTKMLQDNANQQEVPPSKKEKNEGVGNNVRKMILDGMSNKDILAKIHELYGNTNTTYACVAWYRNKLKKDGGKIKSSNGTSLEWLQNFAKANNLSEESTEELKQAMQVA